MQDTPPQAPTGPAGPTNMAAIFPADQWEPDPDLLRESEIMLEVDCEWERRLRAAYAKQCRRDFKKLNGGDPAAAKASSLQPGSVREGNGQLIGEVDAQRDLATPELTLFTNARGPLTKQYTLDADGNLVKIEGGQMVAGTAMRIPISDMQALADLIGTVSSNQALALGSMRVDLPAQVTVVTKEALNGVTAPDIISRSQDYLTFGEGRRGFCLGDFDRKGITAEVQDKLEQSGGFVAALEMVIPELKTTGYVMRASTSAGLFRTDSGQRFADSGGIHLYLQIEDISDSERFLKTLHDRCWLLGLGWYVIDAAGRLLTRSIVDRAVGTPERLCFEGPPLLGPGLAQDKAARMPKVVDGNWLDTQAACPPLSAIEQSRLKELQTKAAFPLKAECARVRTAWLQRRTTEIATRCGMTEQAARRIAIKHADGVLLPAVELTFADPAIGVVTVGAVLADPDKYVDEPLADPLEGPSYGRQTAKVLRRPDGSIFIKSFAHGGQTFELKFDAETIKNILDKTNASNAIETMINHVLTGSLDEVETDALVRQAAKAADVGLRPVQQKLKQARERHEKQQEAEKRAMALMNHTDPRPQIQAPLPDAERLPVIQTINEIVGAVGGKQPPARGIEHDMVRVRKSPILNMHAFTPAGANPEEATAGEVEAAAKLPPPEQWMLYKMSEMEVAELIERHINFYVENEFGVRRSVCLATPFVKHYMKRDDDTLPTLAAIATSPIVLADGNMLAPDGLDRLRGIQFIIPDELRAIIPRSEDCTPDAVKAAMEFLCDEWLCDVATDFQGKAISIALALTLIERSLLDQRPCFRVTAGRRGSGKTTLITLLILAVTGTRPAAAAWSSDENERRKSLFAYLLAGVPSIVWDNIPRGTKIACPHIERSCTTELYADRVLGVSEIHATSASTINIFTGNNIEMRGDLAARDLHIRLDVDRPDPENRNFKHPDAVEWTKDHRGKILRALYAVLLGNPQLKAAHDAPAKTRFKMWWRLVGSAVEHAAKLTGQELDFKKLFITQEEDDEDSASLADVLDILMKKWSKGFSPLGLAKMVNDLQEYERVDAQTVRDFLLAGKDHFISEKSVGRLLTPHVDAAVPNGLILRKTVDSHTRAVTYYVKRLGGGK